MELHDVIVEAELIQQRLKCVCAWHFKNFGFELVMRDGDEPVTSSICEQCREILYPRTH